MRNKKWVLLILFTSGLAILLLPDQGKQVIHLNKSHGPSIQDLIGLGLILISWFFSCVVVIRNRKEIKIETGNKIFKTLIITYLLSIIGIILSLAQSYDLTLWICVAIGSSINILLIIYAFNKK